MKSSITPEQITEWFIFGSQFTNIRITDEVTEKPETTSPVRNCPSQLGSPSKDPPDGGLRRPTTELLGSGVPRLASYEYPRLPITKNRQELVSLVENNSVVIIRGATGSGKTTQLPQFILDHYSEKNAPCNIVVTQPRKIGATSIARWVATERRCTLGSLVGYQVGLEKMATEHTRLIYVTTGVLLQKLVAAKTLNEFSHIFVDEVHERTDEMDFLLLVIRKLLHSNSRYVKVVLMSATINCREFAEYFGSPVRGQMNPAYVFEVDGAPYAIEQSYLDDLRALCPGRVVPMSSHEPNISQEMYNIAISLIQSFDEMETKDQCKKTEQDVSLKLPERGSVLVFLPGLKEIGNMQEGLATLVRRRLQVYPLHSTVTMEEQNGVFLVPVPGYRKIILSTNIAESSVTVPDVKYVIDFCLARHLVCDNETNYQSLRLTWASKTNCNQRKGRAGRVSKGYCYRMITKDFWENDIPEYMVPEMLVAPLTSIMLKVKLLDMGNPRVLLSTALSPPNLQDIVRTVLQLKEMGALSAKNDRQNHNDDGELTFLGRVLAHLPVDLRLGKMIALGHVFGCLQESLIIVACLSLKSFFAMPYNQMMAGFRTKLGFANGIPSDAIAFLNAFKAWHTAKKTGQLRHPKDELDWGKENFIQIRRIREVTELYEDLRKRVAHFNMIVPESPPPTDYTSTNRQNFIIQMVIAGAYYPHYFVQGEMDEAMAAKDLCGHDPRTTVVVRNLPPYCFLYYKQLQSLFRQCGQVKAIFFDSSRAYVEFTKTAGATGVLTEVTLALLLANQKQVLDLFTYPNDEVQACSAGRAISHMKYTRVHVDFQNNTLRPVGLLSSTVELEKLPPTQKFAISITEVLEVGRFWGYRADEASKQKQESLTRDINGRPLQPVAVSPHPNLLCLAPFVERSGSQYHRANVRNALGTTVEVFFVDFGNTASVPCSSLRELPPDLASQPFQAHEFYVVGMRPSAQSLILGDQWSQRARDRYIKLTRGHEALVELYSTQQGVLHVELFIPSKGQEALNVARVMVEEGHALPALEGYNSQQNHEQMMSMYKDMADKTYVPNSAGGSWQDRLKEQTDLISDLLARFKDNKSYLKTKVRVNGPNSPHRVSFHSFSHSTYYKSVSIQKCSLNSGVVNEMPQYKHQRMLVAGSVAVSAESAHILLRDTTLMPDIPGLPALITMLFTPVMELRTNAERTRYTGVLCGLGWNSNTLAPVLPERDMELAFDCFFDVEDITETNALRDSINRLLSEGSRGLMHMGQDHIARLQEDCQDRLVRLCARTPAREEAPPHYYERLGQWNQVDPALKMAIVQPEGGEVKSVPFLLHPVILLDT
ncbi:ATP-dependent RNA helicase TDRD9 [Gadus chalcogrammus]|uniref:ATP-dependent RNA helicase TDRD9 n=1 Tax=Gadus chalcogrammus TaxID=1042646 RepID=UPI0024C31F46|nr:ATP-dependent RNA helicase TDRD9 [Gadus chalcogrammus]